MTNSRRTLLAETVLKAGFLGLVWFIVAFHRDQIEEGLVFVASFINGQLGLIAVIASLVLSVLVMTIVKISRYYISALSDPCRLLMLALAAAIALTLIPNDIISNVFVGILAFGLHLVDNWPIREQEEIPEDLLRRRHIANQLCALILNRASISPVLHCTRIAIVGPWGTGKTFMMDMIEQNLMRAGYKSNQKHQYPLYHSESIGNRSNAQTIARVKPILGIRLSRINPWGCTSEQEAWAAISKGFDDALLQQSLVPASIAMLPLTFLVQKLVGPTPISKEIYSALVETSSGRAEAMLNRVSNTIIRKKLHIVILVDDMERTDAKTLRQLFPVINKLSILKNCTFVFGIDIERVSKAFGEASRGDDETKGYLDKIFDFQIELPVPDYDDCKRFAEAISFKSEYPKLCNSMNAIDKFSRLVLD